MFDEQFQEGGVGVGGAGMDLTLAGGWGAPDAGASAGVGMPSVVDDGSRQGMLRSPVQQLEDPFVPLEMTQQPQAAYFHSQPHLPPQPPAHLFAGQFSPFANASFEVEGDLNGVNPSEQHAMYMRKAALAQGGPRQGQPPLMQGSYDPGLAPMHLTSPDDGTHMFAPLASSSPIGHLSGDMPVGSGSMGPMSLAPAPYDLLDGQAHRGTKRARGFNGAPVHAPVENPYATAGFAAAAVAPSAYGTAAGEVEEPRSLVASTFDVFGAQDPQLQSLLATQQANRNHGLRVDGAMLPTRAGHSLRHHQSTPSSDVRSLPSGVDSPPRGTDSPLVKEESKKVKHQMTDRQRRAKIKESMDLLKAQLPLDASHKADQATIVASSVTLIGNLKDELQELKDKLQKMEMSQASAQSSRKIRGMMGDDPMPSLHPNLPPPLSNSPFSSMQASLNGAGVAMWRMGLNGVILEVNLVFELVSGFPAQEVVGKTPCHPPMFGSLSIMPQAFLKAFSSVAAVPQIQAQNYQQHASQDSSSASSVSTPTQTLPTAPHSPAFSTASGAGSARPVTPDYSAQHGFTAESNCQGPNVTAGNALVNPTSTAQGEGGSVSQTSVAPLYANASISNFPIVPQAALKNFFPYKCRSLIDAVSSAGVTQPQPHGNFLVNHLAALPHNHVLKLLCRHHTLWGEILESIVTLCLVRDEAGQPDYIMALSTPDCRRLLTPATHHASPHMGVVSPSQDTCQ